MGARSGDRLRLIARVFSPTAQMHILFSISDKVCLTPRRQLVFRYVATPTPLNRASISCNSLIGCYLAFADSAFVRVCYRADNNSILMSTEVHIHAHMSSSVSLFRPRGLRNYSAKSWQIRKTRRSPDRSCRFVRSVRSRFFSRGKSSFPPAPPFRFFPLKFALFIKAQR